MLGNQVGGSGQLSLPGEIWNPIQEMSLSHGDTFSCILMQNWGLF